MPWTLVLSSGSRRVVLWQVRAIRLSDWLWAGPASTGGVVTGLSLAFRISLLKVRSVMAGRIEDDFMSAEYDGRLIATARYCEGAVDDGRGVWAVSGLPGRL